MTADLTGISFPAAVMKDSVGSSFCLITSLISCRADSMKDAAPPNPEGPLLCAIVQNLERTAEFNGTHSHEALANAKKDFSQK
jgi:hypothetical protein